MNTDNATRDATTTAAATAPDTGTVPDTSGPSGAVWDALTANPGGSVADIATTAGVSPQVARRTLTALELSGHATRTPGGRKDGKRASDAWHPATTPDTGSDPASAEKTDTPAATVPSEEAAPAPATPAELEEAAGADTGDEATDEGQMEAAAVTDAQDALAALAIAISSALEALDAGDQAAALAAAETIYGGSGKTRRLIRTAVRPRSASGKARSQPGELRAKVAGHLAAYPGKEFTPHEVAKVIGHSAGAVANALDRLTGSGEAVETCDRPRRFTAPTSTRTDMDARTAPAVTV